VPRNQSEKRPPGAQELIDFALLCEKHNYKSSAAINDSILFLAREVLSPEALTLMPSAGHMREFRFQAKAIFERFGRGDGTQSK